jgi:undecaprenyl-diphosphatase
MAAVAVAMTLNLKWWGVPWIIIAVLTGISRIYCGAHFPGQVLWGWCVGIAVGFAVHFLWRAIETWRRQRSEPATAGANHAE